MVNAGSENTPTPHGEPRLLMIACAFPPTGGAGVQRTLKFAKYLGMHGWNPIVWSAPHVPHLPLDPSMCHELPDTVEHTTRPTLDPMGRAERTIEMLDRKLEHSPRFARIARAIATRLGTTGRKWLDLSVPDAHVFWALRSDLSLRRMIRARGVRAIFSTYSPASNHLLASWLKRSTGLPWIADFRDLWTNDERYVTRSRLRRALDRRLEQRVLREADVVTATTDGQRDRLAEIANAPASKFRVITNGVDFADVDRARRSASARNSEAQRKSFRLVFAGQLQSTSVTEDYFRGIGTFARASAQTGLRFEFRVVGQVSHSLQQEALRNGVRLTTTGYRPHVEAIREMLDADALLIPVPLGSNARWCVPAKTYEYLAARRPILVVGPADSALAKLVARFHGHRVVPRTAEAIADALMRLARRNASDSRACADRTALAPFDRRALAGSLAELLNEVAPRPRRITKPDTTSNPPTTRKPSIEHETTATRVPQRRTQSLAMPTPQEVAP